MLSPIFLCTACFRVGIPERFYSYEIKQEKPTSIQYPNVFISIPSRLETYGLDESKSDQILGHQFIFGFIPFTSLYLAHGLESFFLESLIQYFQSEGIAPIIVTEELAKAYNIDAVRFSGELSVSVYDLFFSRLINFSGELRIKGEIVEIQFSDLYSQAQYPLIGHLLQNSFLTALSESNLTKLLTYARSTSFIGDKGFIPVLVDFPEIEDLSSLDRFAHTYGDKNGVFSSAMLARITQRGAELGLESISNISALALAANFSNAKAFSEFSTIKIKLIELKITDSLNLKVHYRVSGAEFICSIVQEIDESRDGELVFALEHAIKSTIEDLLLKKNRICEKVN